MQQAWFLIGFRLAPSQYEGGAITISHVAGGSPRSFETEAECVAAAAEAAKAFFPGLVERGGQIAIVPCRGWVFKNSSSG